MAALLPHQPEKLGITTGSKSGFKRGHIDSAKSTFFNHAKRFL